MNKLCVSFVKLNVIKWGKEHWQSDFSGNVNLILKLEVTDNNDPFSLIMKFLLLASLSLKVF